MPYIWSNGQTFDVEQTILNSYKTYMEKKYQIFDKMIEGIQIISKDWRYVYVNDTVVKHGKSSREELIGYTMMEKYPGIEQSPFFNFLKKCMQESSYQQMVNEFTFPDGSIGYFELRMEKIDEGVLILSHDITDQKRAEKLIKRTNEELEKLIIERTQEITSQKEIIEKQIQHLEELNNTKNKFFNIVSHDLKTPLNNLSAFTNILVDNIEDLDKSELVEMGKQIKISIDNTIKMADNLIIWATIQMNEYEYNRQTFRAEEIIMNIIDLYKDIAERKKIVLKHSIEDALMITGDKNQIEFIIRNIINNAIKFTPKNGFVTLTAKSLSEEKVLISVSDTGIGIPDQIKNTLFTINNKTSTVGTNGESGTGLGLMLCNEFAQLNDGEIEIESTSEKGTTVNIRLPK